MFKEKPARKTILIAAIFFIFLLIWTLWQFHFNYMVASYDTIFHSQRIYEIRLAFLNHTLPSWLNFNTFFFTGQAINGMYPDYTLWPFVWITNFLTPIHQIIAIRALIAAGSFVVTFLSLNKRFSSQNAVLAASIFALSGSVLKDLTGEMQSGTAIIMMFIFPILFTLKDIIQSKNWDLKLVLKTALLMTIVVNSHLLSAVTITIVAGICLIIETILRKNFWSWINLLAAAFLTILLSLPIIERVMAISKSGLLSPFGKGNIISLSLWELVKKPDWDAKATISGATIVFLVIALAGLRKSNLKRLLPWLVVELILVILSSNIFPWKLFNSLPIINNFQYANWRFGIFLGVIPILLILLAYEKRLATIILMFLTLVSYPMAIYTANHNQHFKADNAVVVTQFTQKQIPQNKTVKLTSTGINSDKIMRSLLPDYTPDTTPLQKDSDGMFLDGSIIYPLANHLGQTPQKDFILTPKSTIKSVTWSGQNIPKGNITLPSYGYKSLQYRITLNGQPIAWHLSDHGLITINIPKNLQKMDVKIKWLTPKVYPVLLIFSSLLYLLLLGYLIRLNPSFIGNAFSKIKAVL